MGEISEMIIEGILCQVCVGIVDENDLEGPGYPRTCKECKKELNIQEDEDE